LQKDWNPVKCQTELQTGTDLSVWAVLHPFVLSSYNSVSHITGAFFFRFMTVTDLSLHPEYFLCKGRSENRKLFCYAFLAK